MAVPSQMGSQKLPLPQPQGGSELFCQPCDRADERLPVFGYCVDCEEYLCQLCYQTHTRPKPVQHHQLLDKEHMPLAPQTSLEPTQSRKDCDLTKPCPEHAEEMIKFYCHDHNALICSVCVDDEHSQASCQTDYIPDISEQSLDSTEFNKTIKDLDKMKDKCCRITEHLKLRINKSSSSLAQALEEMENIREEFNKKFDELKQEINDTLKTTKKENKKSLKKTETKWDDITKSLQTSADTLKDYNTNQKADQLFAELKIAQQLILDKVKKLLNPSTAKDVEEYTFEPNQAVKALLKNEKSFGTLHGKMKQTQSTNQTVTSMKMSYPRYLDVRTQSDENNCQINGITFSTQNQVIVADHDNQSIKMIDIETGSIKQIELESEPWDVTTITSDTLAVTMPYAETIQFVSFSSKSLALKNELKVNGMCFGVSNHQEKLAVTFPIESKLLIMNLEGTTEIEVVKDSNGDDMFSHPEYVTTNDLSVYVSDRDKSAVLWLNWQGEMMGRFDRIKWPSGIACLDDRSFVVIDNYSNCVIHSFDNCKGSEIVLDGIYKPHALGWCPETSTLCVSRDNPFKEEGDNHIVLYNTIMKYK